MNVKVMVGRQMVTKKTNKENNNIHRAEAELEEAEAGLVKTKNQLRVFWICYFGIPCIMSFVVLAIFAFKSSKDKYGEPLTFFDSISIWPTELICLFSGFLAIYYILQSYKSLILNSEEITQHLVIENGKENLSIKLKKNFQIILEYWNIYCNKDLKKSGKYIWSAVCTGSYSFAACRFLKYSEMPITPLRGHISKHTDNCIFVFSALSILFLTWYVIISVHYCRGFFSDIIDSKKTSLLSNMFNTRCTISIVDSCKEEDQVCLDKLTKCLSEYDKLVTDHVFVLWLKINVIAKRTEIVGKMITYPFIVFTLLLISRNKFFDHWTWPIPLVIVIIVIILIVLYYAIVLFYDANNSRRQTITRLYEERMKLLNIQIPTKFNVVDDRISEFIEQKTKYIDVIISDLQNLKNGAFTPLRNSPVLIAILAPLGGMGSIAILQYLVQFFNK